MENDGLQFLKKGTFSPFRTGKRKLPTVKRIHVISSSFNEDSKKEQNRSPNSLVKRVQRLSTRAADITKKKLWDEIDLYDAAAQSAVDKYEDTYNAARSLLVKSFTSAKDIFYATRDGVEQIDHHLLEPVKDIVILPAFSGVEFAVGSTVKFLESKEAVEMANNSLNVIKKTPFIGEHMLAPAILMTAHILKDTYEIVKYPIPSRETVRHAVNEITSGTKFLVAHTWREVYFYAKLVDSSFTRVMSFGQWRVLGYGPYSTLDRLHKKDVIDHLCDRYFAMEGDIERYELIAQIKQVNVQLYYDIVVKEILLDRGAQDDVWLHQNPEYISKAQDIMLEDNCIGVSPLWVYLGQDSHQSIIPKSDAILIEKKYLEFLRKDSCEQADETSFEEHKHEHEINDANVTLNDTVAHWYDPTNNDVLVDQKRNAISFIPCCRQCSNILSSTAQNFCDQCELERWHLDKKQCRLITPFRILKRPTLWRFYGEGQKVRRGVWLLETKSKGIQSYDKTSSAILEDAYLYLKWRESQMTPDSFANSVITVQVNFKDEVQLVQFRSLKQITAIQKSLVSGMSLFKRRVYRGIQQIESKDTRDILAAPVELAKKNCLDFDKHETNPDEIDHLVLVVHGIGEMLHTVDVGLPLASLTSSIIDCCDSLRKNHREVVSSKADPQSGFIEKDRTEFIPIEWHEPFALRSRSNDKGIPTINDITLQTIPHLRNFANDTMLDILFFMSPHHHDMMVDIVISELNTVYTKFQHLTNYEGKVSIISHSLGSVICWDILSHQRKVNRMVHALQTRLSSNGKCNTSTFLEAPSSPGFEYPSLNFAVEHNFMIGSPVAVFLMMRNKSESSNYSHIQLPGCKHFYNVFHPFDPCAYRLEPLMDADSKYIDPVLIPHWKFGLRFHYQTKFWLKSLVNSTEKAIDSFTLFGENEDNEAELNQDRVPVRLDFMLQENEIESANEYISALAAHSSYWDNKDLSLFIAQQL